MCRALVRPDCMASQCGLLVAGMDVSQHLNVPALLLHSLYTAGELAYLAGLACIHTMYHVVLLDSQPDTGDMFALGTPDPTLQPFAVHV
jgi:hypothetical protein